MVRLAQAAEQGAEMGAAGNDAYGQRLDDFVFGGGGNGWCGGGGSIGYVDDACKVRGEWSDHQHIDVAPGSLSAGIVNLGIDYLFRAHDYLHGGITIGTACQGDKDDGTLSPGIGFQHDIENVLRFTRVEGHQMAPF